MRIASLLGHLQIDSETLRTLPACREDRPPFYGFGAPHNMGDWFVTRATLHMLDAEEIYNIHPTAPAKEFEIINKECDVLILKGGNFLSGNWLAKNIGYEVLKKIRIPIIYIGAGLQAPIGGKVEFSPEEIRCLKYIHDSAKACGVRGERTQEALAKIGIANATVIGCPTLFWSMKPTLHIKPPAFGKVGWTMRDSLLSLGADAHRKQFALMEYMRGKAQEFSVMLQGEEVALQEYFMYHRWGKRLRSGRKAVENSPTLYRSWHAPVQEQELRTQVIKKYGTYTDAEFLDWVMKHTFFSFDAAEYLDYFRAQDFVLGCRLHGNLVALSQGTPAFYFTYDERTQEMVDLFHIPHAKISEFTPGKDSLEASWEKCEQAYAHYYQELVKFFAANNIKHKLA